MISFYLKVLFYKTKVILPLFSVSYSFSLSCGIDFALLKGNPGGIMKILIVEDEPQSIHYITKILHKWGHSSEPATTGKMALNTLKKSSFDMILLDIVLPDYKGYDLIPKFKNIHPEIHIITMTGHNSRELELKVRNQGILYYMVKPIETKNFKLILDHIKSKI